MTAALAAGPVNVSLSDADFGLQASEGKTAFELKKGTFSATIDGLASVTADSVLVQYTGATTTVTAGTALTVGGTTYTFAEEIAANTVAVEATGFAANVADFVTLSGDLGFKKSGATIIAVGSDVTAALAAGPVNVSLSDAEFGLQASEGKTAFELKNGTFSATIDGLASDDGGQRAGAVYGREDTVRPRDGVDGGTADDVHVHGDRSRSKTVAVEATGFAANGGGLCDVGGEPGFQKRGRPSSRSART